MGITQPALTRIIARLERGFGGRLFERLPAGVRLTPLGASVTESARRVLHEIEATEASIDTARAGRTGRFRVTASPLWSATVLPEAIASFQDACPRIKVTFETTTRAGGLRRLADGEADLHCGGIDSAERLPEFLRRERFLDITASIVAWRGHPLLGADVTLDDLAHCAWVDFRETAAAAPGNDALSLAALLERLYRTHTRVRTIVRTGTAGLLMMAGRPYLTWLPLTFLERLPRLFLQPLPIEFGRYRYRSGFVARRAAEELPPFRRFAAILRSTALHPGD